MQSSPTRNSQTIYSEEPVGIHKNQCSARDAMNKRKTLLILVTAVISLGSYFMYTNTITYWDAYAYEVSLTDNVIPEFTIEVSNEELATYPELAAFLDEVDLDNFVLMSFEEGDAIYQYEEIVDSKEPENPYDYIYLQTPDRSYEVNFTMYGGMDDMPVYLWIAGLSALVVAGLVASEALGYLKRD